MNLSMNQYYVILGKELFENLIEQLSFIAEKHSLKDSENISSAQIHIKKLQRIASNLFRIINKLDDENNRNRLIDKIVGLGRLGREKNTNTLFGNAVNDYTVVCSIGEVEDTLSLIRQSFREEYQSLADKYIQEIKLTMSINYEHCSNLKKIVTKAIEKEKAKERLVEIHESSERKKYDALFLEVTDFEVPFLAHTKVV